MGIMEKKMETTTMGLFRAEEGSWGILRWNAWDFGSWSATTVCGHKCMIFLIPQMSS